MSTPTDTPPYMTPPTNPVPSDRAHPLTSPEILSVIFHHFTSTLDHSHPDYVDLVKFSRVSRTWNKAVTPLIYRHVVVRGDGRHFDLEKSYSADPCIVHIANSQRNNEDGDNDPTDSDVEGDSICSSSPTFFDKYVRVVTVHDHDEDDCPFYDMCCETYFEVQPRYPNIHTLILRAPGALHLRSNCGAYRVIQTKQLIAYVGFGDIDEQLQNGGDGYNPHCLFWFCEAIVFVLGPNFRKASKEVQWVLNGTHEEFDPVLRFVLSPLTHQAVDRPKPSTQTSAANSREQAYPLKIDDVIILAEMLLSTAIGDIDPSPVPHLPVPARIYFDSPIFSNDTPTHGVQELLWEIIYKLYKKKVEAVAKEEGEDINSLTENDHLNNLFDQVDLRLKQEEELNLDSLINYFWTEFPILKLE